MCWMFVSELSLILMIWEGVYWLEYAPDVSESLYWEGFFYYKFSEPVATLNPIKGTEKKDFKLQF